MIDMEIPFREILAIILPLFLAGVLHHFFVIKYNLCSILAVPLDQGRNVFGNNKTWRGIIVMTVLSGGLFWMESFIFPLEFKVSVFIGGCFLGVGYSLGELPNSFLKRRLKISPGQLPEGKIKILFLILDHTDSVLGCLLMLFWIYDLNFALTISLLIFGGVLHFLVNQVLCKWGYKKN